MRPEYKIAKAYSESKEFGRYAEVMLETIPDMSPQNLRDCYKHNATAREYLDQFDRRSEAAKRRKEQP